MAELWYFTCEGKQMEPVTAAEIKSLASSGFLCATDMVWKEGMAGWSKAGDVPGLIPAGAPVLGQTAKAKSYKATSPSSSRPTDDDLDEPRPRRRRRSEDDDERDTERNKERNDDRPRRRREPAKGMSGLTLSLIIGGVAVAVIAVVGVIIAVAIHSNSGKMIATYPVDLQPTGNSFREFQFQFGTLYEFKVRSDIQTDIDLIIENNFGQAIAGDWSVGPSSFLRWSPTVTGNYRVKLQNQDFGLGNHSTVTIRSIGTSRGPIGNGVPPMAAQGVPPNFPQPQVKIPNPFPINPPAKNPVGPTTADRLGQVQPHGQLEKVIVFPKSKRIEVTLHSEVVENNVDLFVVDQKGVQIAADTSIGPNSRLSFLAKAGQSYTFRVRNFGEEPTDCTLTYTRP